MEFEAIEALRDKHPAWRLLRAGNASLILSFLGNYFVEGNRGASSASELATALDEHLYVLNAEIQTADGGPRFPKKAVSHDPFIGPLAYIKGRQVVRYDPEGNLVEASQSGKVEYLCLILTDEMTRP